MDSDQKWLLMREFKDGLLPKYEQLASNEIEKYNRKLSKKIVRTLIEDMFGVVSSIGNIIGIIKDYDDEINFDLKKILNKSFIYPQSKIIVAWSPLDYDYFSLDDFSNFFSGLWFRASTDILIFDKSCCWILLINHEGAVIVLRR